jgi:outer membrane lipoprotein SlyB
MKKKSNWLVVTLFMIVLLTGCASRQQDAMEYYEKSVTEKRWRSAFLHYIHIFKTGSKNDLSIASNIAKNNPEIAEYGFDLFTTENLRKEIDTYNAITPDLLSEADAVCNLATEEKCNVVLINLKAAESWVDKNRVDLIPITLVQSAFDKLSKNEKLELEIKYKLSFYDGNYIGVITERQIQNLSTAGSTVGSDAGSALASVVYINNALDTGSYNVWTDISVAVAGAVAGSGANKAPVTQYVVKYTIRNLNNQIKSTEVSQGTPLGEPIGTCFNLTWRKAIDSEFCTMTAVDIRKKYLTKAK